MEDPGSLPVIPHDFEIPSNNDDQLVWIMPALDNIGKIAAAQIAFYTPIAAITLFLIFRYAFRRDAGWFWLFFFSAGNSTAFYIILFCFMEFSSTNCQWSSPYCRRIAVAD